MPSLSTPFFLLSSPHSFGNSTTITWMKYSEWTVSRCFTKKKILGFLKCSLNLGFAMSNHFWRRTNFANFQKRPTNFAQFAGYFANNILLFSQIIRKQISIKKNFKNAIICKKSFKYAVIIDICLLNLS